MALGIMVAASTMIIAGHAVADTLAVTKTLDTRDRHCDSDCSLREAVIAANQHPGRDTIILAAGTYVLQQVSQDDSAAAGDLDILDDLTVTSGGGVSNYGMAIVRNTIIARSHRGRTCAGDPPLSGGYNLDEDGSCGFLNAGELFLVTPNLAPLGDYGGPTLTHALCTGLGMPDPSCSAASPAIDAGENAPQCRSPWPRRVAVPASCP